jgi:hypothetical protein
MASGWVMFKVAMAGAAIIEGITTFIRFAKALRAAAVAQGFLNVVMTANPIGAIIVGVAALIGGLILLIDNFDLVKAGFKKMVGFLAKLSIDMMNTILHPFDALRSTLGGIIGFFKGGKGSVSAAAEVNQQIAVERTAPNATALAAQEVQFNGQLNIAGAPEGSTFESTTTGAPAIQTEMMGAQ